MNSSITRQVAAGVVAMLAMATPAFAHHAMGGQMPQSLMQGFLAGLGHPVIGVDHLAAILGVGLFAGFVGRGVLPVLAFSAAVIAGVGLHIARIDLPGGELLVGLTTLAIGALLLLRPAMGVGPAALLFALAGLVHGHALGESIVGAETSPLLAYLAGLFLVQTAIGLGACLAGRRLVAAPARIAAFSAAGALVALTGGVAMAAGLLG